MAYKIKFDPDTEKQLKKIDKKSLSRIIDFLKEKIASAENPRLYGKPLKGDFENLWRYRVGDYRIICKIIDSTLTVFVVRVGNRKSVYS